MKFRWPIRSDPYGFTGNLSLTELILMLVAMLLAIGLVVWLPTDLPL